MSESVPEVFEEQQPTVPWRPLEALAVFGLAIVGLFIVSLPLAVVFLDPERPLGSDLLVALNIALLPVCLGASVLLWVRWRHKLGPAAIGLRGFNGRNVTVGAVTALGGLVMTWILGVVVSLLIEALSGEPLEPPSQITFDSEPTGMLLAITGLAVVVLAPIAEEMFYRGFLYPALRRRRGVVRAIVVSSIWFGISHFQFGVGSGSFLEALRDSSVIVVPITLLGALFAYVVERERSLVPVMVAHGIFNAFGFTMLFLV